MRNFGTLRVDCTNAKFKMQNAKFRVCDAIIMLRILNKLCVAKPILLASFSSEGGQGTRPRPVGDTGSVSWRSGQNCAK